MYVRNRMERRTVAVLFDEGLVAGCPINAQLNDLQLHGWQLQLDERKIRGSCSRPVGRAGAQRGEVVRAAEWRVGVKSGGVKGEREGRRSEGWG
jgi:hypothetical protein